MYIANDKLGYCKNGWPIELFSPWLPLVSGQRVLFHSWYESACMGLNQTGEHGLVLISFAQEVYFSLESLVSLQGCCSIFLRNTEVDYIERKLFMQFVCC